MTLPLELGGIHDDNVRRALEQIAVQFPVAATGGGGGAPSGPAGGVLGGTYPNPGFAADMATQAELDAHAVDTTSVHGIADTSLLVVTSDPRLTDARTPTAHKVSHEPGGTDALTGLTNASIAAAAGIAKTKLANLDVVNADVNAAAAIAESKLNLATDAAAGTGSRRTLGTTATSAAAGNRGLPVGGTSGQVLAKNSATDYDAGWTAAGGSPSTVLTQYKTIQRASSAHATQAGAATWLANLLGTSAAAGAAGSALWAFYLDPADQAFAGTTNQLRLRTSLHCNAVAPTGTITGALYPVATWGGASGASPTVATVGAVTLSNAYVTPAANSHTRTDGAPITFPTAGWFVFVLANSGAMAAGSQLVMHYELQARQV